MFVAPIILTTLSVILVLWGDATGRPSVRAVFKVLASAGFLILALLAGAQHHGAVGFWLLAALVTSTLGDIALIGKSKAAVGGGLGFFFLAHVAFLGAFLTLGIAPVHFAGWAVVLALFSAGIWRWLGPHTGSLKPAVAAYVGVISLMVAGAGALASASGRVDLLVCAVVFMASDLCVARHRFVAPGLINRQIGLPLYYAAQLGFAWFLVQP